MKHQNITFSIPEDLKAKLQVHVRKGQLSPYISKAIFKALREEELKIEKDLDAAYEAASLDFDRLKVLKECNKIDDVADLSREDEDWTWLKNTTEKEQK